MRCPRPLALAIVIILAAMILITAARFNEGDSEPSYFGKFTIVGNGSGGPSFNLTRSAELHYEVSGSTFDVYVGATEQLSNYGNDSSFGYDEEISIINSSSAKVDGILEQDSYGIIVDNHGNGTVEFYYEVKYASTSVHIDWYAPIMLVLTASMVCIILLIAYRHVTSG